MKIALKCALLTALTFFLANQAFANPCPPGNPPPIVRRHRERFGFTGTPIPHTYTQYSVDFTATAASTNISFAFREDPAFLHLDDVSVILKTGGPELILNGGFEAGPVGANAPTNWTF